MNTVRVILKNVTLCHKQAPLNTHVEDDGENITTEIGNHILDDYVEGKGGRKIPKQKYELYKKNPPSKFSYGTASVQPETRSFRHV